VHTAGVVRGPVFHFFAVDSARLLNTRSLGLEMNACGGSMHFRIVGLSESAQADLGTPGTDPARTSRAALNQSWMLVVPSGNRLAVCAAEHGSQTIVIVGRDGSDGGDRIAGMRFKPLT
jgi:hypothetical protein